MADVADAEHVADNAVAIAVDLSALGLQIIDDHLALQDSALHSVEADIVGISVEGQRVHVQLAGLAVGRLAVEPDHGLFVVGCVGERHTAERNNHDHCQKHCQNLFHVCSSLCFIQRISGRSAAGFWL